MARTGRPTEHAFTMIELIVGFVLLVIVIGMVGSVLIQALTGSNSATGGAMSDTTIARVVARFQDDLAVAETSDRAGRLVREQVVLDAALQENRDAPSDNPSDPRLSVDLEDVLAATPTRFQVQADVDRDLAGVECVTWNATTTGTKYQVTRTVQSQGCVGAAETEELLAGRSDATGAVTAPFSYLLMCNRTICGADSLAPAGQPCATWSEPSPSGRKKLRWVVAVQAQFVTNSGRAATNGKSGARMNIRSREEHMWKTALGC